jgi:uncharacterized protein YcbX
MHVSALRIYPVKSMAGLDVTSVAVHPWGFEQDRRWMVVDPAGTTITARTHPTMLHVLATPHADGALTLQAPDRELVHVPVPEAAAHRLGVVLSRVGWALPAGAEVDGWLSEYLGEAVRLVWLDDPGRRTVSEKHGGRAGDTMALADAGPILLTSTASLRQLDDWMAQTAQGRGEPAPKPLSMLRFRPNIVIEDAEQAFAEDDWKRVRVGEIDMRFGEYCDRCALPTIDPVTLAGGKEPTRTLALRRQWDHKVHFGVRFIPEASGVLRVGDAVTVG